MSVNPIIPTTVVITVILISRSVVKYGIAKRPDLASTQEQHFLIEYIDWINRGYFGLVAGADISSAWSVFPDIASSI